MMETHGIVSVRVRAATVLSERRPVGQEAREVWSKSRFLTVSQGQGRRVCSSRRHTNTWLGTFYIYLLCSSYRSYTHI